jgi:pimeloyl-ACP methyl ester carboxylesterase
MPWLPEWALARKELKALQEIWKGLSFELRHKFAQKFEQKNILTASLNYYRANFDYLTTGQAEHVPNEKVKVPTLYIWGNQDPAVSPLAAKKTQEYVEGYYKSLELETAHWPVQEKYQQVFDALLNHLSNNKKTDTIIE